MSGVSEDELVNAMAQAGFAVQFKNDCSHVEQKTWTPPSSVNINAPCGMCGDVGENWLCLECFGVHCSRYRKGCHQKHCSASGHRIAKSLADLSVWCDACGEYIESPLLQPINALCYSAKFPASTANPHAPTPAPAPTDSAKWHGYMLKDAGLPPPECVAECDDLARPKYTKIRAAEYMDRPEALHAKAELVAELIRKAKRGAIFAGAGLSTSAGCQDYASNAKGSLVQAPKQRLTHEFVVSMRPTPAHRVLAALQRTGQFKVAEFVQQNHDGLAQKAGFPHALVNEIHGQWLGDPGPGHVSMDREKNPVVPMSGNLREDLFQRVLDAEQQADFCLAIGTSMSGLNVERVPRSVARRHMTKGQGLGTVIATIQQTPADELAAVRVFAKCDDFMMLVAEKMKLHIDFETDYDYDTAKPKTFPPSANKHPFKTGVPSNLFPIPPTASAQGGSSSAAAAGGSTAAAAGGSVMNWITNLMS